MITALKHLIAVKCLQPLIHNHTKYRQCDQKLSHHIVTCTAASVVTTVLLQYRLAKPKSTVESAQKEKRSPSRGLLIHRSPAQRSTSHFNISSIVPTCLLVKNHLR